MAETTNTQTETSAKPAAKRRSTAAKSRATSRSTTRATTAKAPSTSTGRRQRTIAANETREAAQANVRAAKTTAKQGRNVAERAALVYVGMTLEARDRAVALVNDLRTVTTSRAAAERRIGRFERRGSTARNSLERDVRKARMRLERELRGRRRDAERLVRRNRAQVETVVEASERLAANAKERVTAIA
jgi:hypothetical protein